MKNLPVRREPSHILTFTLLSFPQSFIHEAREIHNIKIRNENNVSVFIKSGFEDRLKFMDIVIDVLGHPPLSPIPSALFQQRGRILTISGRREGEWVFSSSSWYRAVLTCSLDWRAQDRLDELGSWSDSQSVGHLRCLLR